MINFRLKLKQKVERHTAEYRTPPWQISILSKPVWIFDSNHYHFHRVMQKKRNISLGIRSTSHSNRNLMKNGNCRRQISGRIIHNFGPWSSVSEYVIKIIFNRGGLINGLIESRITIPIDMREQCFRLCLSSWPSLRGFKRKDSISDKDRSRTVNYCPDNANQVAANNRACGWPGSKVTKSLSVTGFKAGRKVDRDVHAWFFGFQLNRKVCPLSSSWPSLPLPLRLVFSLSLFFFLIKLPRFRTRREDSSYLRVWTKGIKNNFRREVSRIKLRRAVSKLKTFFISPAANRSVDRDDVVLLENASLPRRTMYLRNFCYNCDRNFVAYFARRGEVCAPIWNPATNAKNEY